MKNREGRNEKSTGQGMKYPPKGMKNAKGKE